MCSWHRARLKGVGYPTTKTSAPALSPGQHSTSSTIEPLALWLPLKILQVQEQSDADVLCDDLGSPLAPHKTVPTLLAEEEKASSCAHPCAST